MPRSVLQFNAPGRRFSDQREAVPQGETEPQRLMDHDSMGEVGRVGMFAVLYAIAFLVLLGCALMQMHQGWRARSQHPRVNSAMRDRTGLKSIHPELLDENGQLIKEDLLTVSFENMSDSPFTSPGAQPGY